MIVDIDVVQEGKESALPINYIVSEIEKNCGLKKKVNHIPMTQIIKNPYCIRNYIENFAGPAANDLMYPVVLIGRDIECAETTGECLVQAGYRNVFVGIFQSEI